MASVLIVLAAWQLSGALGVIDVRYTSTPWSILVSGVDLAASGELWDNARITLLEFAAGFALAVLTGVPLGMLMGWRTRLRQTLEPALVALYVTPSLALLPLIVLALGIGPAAKIAMVFIEAVITIVVNAMAGIRETDAKLVRASRSLCATDFAVFRKVLFPSALPTIVAGLRLGAGRGVIAVIVAELYGGTQGIGLQISTYGQSFAIAPLLFLTLLVAAFGYLVSTGLRIAQRRLSSWQGA
ncbi:ABC transporter permease [Amycolatopsis alkalitolerans]|uniref:ABC transporter permease n=1 Tax=Amycolatopsis alkalitolerans TaxID=2547244 RepID=A0A5C4LPY3_9PSEU|nr:ABC transporter permease [Amycolatopsis alkalitolerans]TNC20210.1 ABC transporter permease [Amycolatopsis alkalitolerans]